MEHLSGWLREHPLLILAVVVVLLIALVLWLRERPPRFAAKPLLTANELEFYHRLRQALPELCIFPQVAMNAFLRPAAGADAERYASTRARFAQKHVDFLLCEPRKLDILMIVELDDSMHSLARDNQRDAMTGEAGYRTLRVHSREKPTPAELRSLVEELLAAPAGCCLMAYDPEGKVGE